MDSMTSAMCLVNRPEQCSGQVISLAYVGPCTGPAHDEPIEDEAGYPFEGGWDR
jgi:hypothetical protein